MAKLDLERLMHYDGALLAANPVNTRRAVNAGQRILEFNGLRCLLSAWVILEHILQCAGYRYETLPPFVRIAAKGEYAVEVFIILSGFVITKLLVEQQEKYLLFIGRRFLRLFPVFAVTLSFGAALHPLNGWMLAVGWPPDPALLSNASASWQSEGRYFWEHLIAHLPMLHGAVPSNILPYSAFAFLGPAWSISLEWQYYLCAPLIVLICKRLGPTGWFLLCLGSILLLYNFGAALNSLFPNGSLLPQKLLLFLVGGSSYWIFMEVSGKHENLPSLMLYFVAPAVLWFTLNIPLAIWTACLSLTLGGHQSRGVSVLRSFLKLSWMQRLGEISYSTYLGHMSCILVVQFLILKFLPHVNQQGMLLGLLVIAVPLTIILSESLYRFVELPGIQFGRRLSRRS